MLSLRCTKQKTTTFHCEARSNPLEFTQKGNIIAQRQQNPERLLRLSPRNDVVVVNRLLRLSPRNDVVVVNRLLRLSPCNDVVVVNRLLRLSSRNDVVVIVLK